MKLELLDAITDGGRFTHAAPNQLIRLYDFDCLQAGRLRQVIEKEIIESNKEVNLTTLDFIQAVNCSLTLTLSNSDKGITLLESAAFVCSLTVERYQEMICLLEPFCNEETTGYQWLYDLDTPIAFLFSPGGWW